MSAAAAYGCRLSGGCHCGLIEVEFETNLKPEAIIPRACQCSFCTRHGAAYISDPGGQLTLILKDRSEVSFYRFGHETADLIICRRCGVLTNALSETDGAMRAVVNIRALPDEVFNNAALETDTDGETPGDRIGRRARDWIGTVIVRQG